MTNKSTNPLIQNNFVLKKLEVGLERDEIDLNRIEIPARGDGNIFVPISTTREASMPTYDYGCERCGPFTETRPMAEFALPF